MTVIETPIKDLLIFEPKIWKDNRGCFFESFSQQAFDNAGIDAKFVQDNQSLSQKGTLRGLHAQAAPFAQAKLVRVIQGRVIDVVVDVRKNSATYKHHFAIELSGENNKQLWIPQGFIHGFLTLTDNTIFCYKVTNYYNKSAEIGIKFNDETLAINWEQYLPAGEFLLSDKDLALPDFNAFKMPF